MDSQRAVHIFQSLLDGVDPTTGELLPEDHVCCQSDVIRALHHAIQAMSQPPSRSHRDKDPDDADEPSNAGKTWTPQEEDLLIEAYTSGVSVTEISHRFQRSRGGIRARLVRLGFSDSRKRVPEIYTPDPSEEDD